MLLFTLAPALEVHNGGLLRFAQVFFVVTSMCIFVCVLWTRANLIQKIQASLTYLRMSSAAGTVQWLRALDLTFPRDP